MGGFFHQKKTVGPSVFHRFFRSIRRTVRSFKCRSPRSRTDTRIYRRSWNVQNLLLKVFEDENLNNFRRKKRYIILRYLESLCFVASQFFVSPFFFHGFCFIVLFCPKKCIVSFPRKRFSPGGDEAGDRDRKPKDMLKDSIQSDDVCANFQLFRI